MSDSAQKVNIRRSLGYSISSGLIVKNPHVQPVPMHLGYHHGASTGDEPSSDIYFGYIAEKG